MYILIILTIISIIYYFESKRLEEGFTTNKHIAPTVVYNNTYLYHKLPQIIHEILLDLEVSYFGKPQPHTFNRSSLNSADRRPLKPNSIITKILIHIVRRFRGNQVLKWPGYYYQTGDEVFIPIINKLHLRPPHQNMLGVSQLTRYKPSFIGILLKNGQIKAMGVTNFRKEYHFRGIGDNPRLQARAFRDFQFGIDDDKGQEILEKREDSISLFKRRKDIDTLMRVANTGEPSSAYQVFIKRLRTQPKLIKKYRFYLEDAINVANDNDNPQILRELRSLTMTVGQ